MYSALSVIVSTLRDLTALWRHLPPFYIEIFVTRTFKSVLTALIESNVIKGIALFTEMTTMLLLLVASKFLKKFFRPASLQRCYFFKS